jgi:predicted transposase/invertase (TIGR01784 family)
MEIHNPHDRFFKEVFSRPEAAAEFFAVFLPMEIVALLDLSKIEQVKDSFIDPALQEHLSDLIYRVPMRSGSEAYIYALIEHKSSPDKWVGVQILRYEVATWDAEIKAKAKRLTPIIPVVFYHGAKRWNVPREFSALVNFAGNEALREYVPEFRYHLTDLSQYEDEAIREAIASVVLLVMMLLMKNIFRKDLKKKLAEIIGLLKSGGDAENLKTVIKYLTETTARLSAEDLQEAVKPLFESREGDIMPTIAETWRREGMQIGLQQGTAALTLRQLQKRFGKIDEPTQSRINGLRFEQLERLGEALLDFKSPDDLAHWLKANAELQSRDKKD